MQLESAITLNIRGGGSVANCSNPGSAVGVATFAPPGLGSGMHGGKPIRLPIMATAVNPNIEFMEDRWLMKFGIKQMLSPDRPKPSETIDTPEPSSKIL